MTTTAKTLAILRTLRKCVGKRSVNGCSCMACHAEIVTTLAGGDVNSVSDAIHDAINPPGTTPATWRGFMSWAKGPPTDEEAHKVLDLAITMQSSPRLDGREVKADTCTDGDVLDATIPRPAADWHEDIGNVLWWRLPVEEPPWVGTPNDGTWPGDGYFTHWTPLVIPMGGAS